VQRSSKEAFVKSWRLVVHLDCQETCDLDYHETLDSDEQDAMVLGKSVDSSEMYALDCQKCPCSVLKLPKCPLLQLREVAFIKGLAANCICLTVEFCILSSLDFQEI
jgi:hypothetical protein